MKNSTSSFLTSCLMQLCTCLTFLLFSACAINTYAATVKNYHPRLFVLGSNQAESASNLNRVRSQLQAGGIYHHAYTEAVAINAQGNSGRFGADYMLKMIKALENTADQNTYIAEAKADVSSGNYYPESYQVAFILAMFDWFRSQWTAAETEQLISYMKEVAKRSEWTDKTVLGNHFHEDHAFIRILPGLVLAGESSGSENGDDLWSGYGSGSLGARGAEYWMDSELRPTFNNLFGSYGMCPEGNGYWRRGHPFLPVLAMAWTSATGEDLFANWTMTKLADGLLYNWRSSDGKLNPWSDGVVNIGTHGDSDYHTRFGAAYKTTFSIFLPLMRWGNSSSGTYVYNVRNIPDYLATLDRNDTGTDYGDIFVRYIIADAFAPRDAHGGYLHTPAPVDTGLLPKSAYLDGYNGVIIRSGWGADDVLFGYKQNPYIAGHDHMDAGSFVISRNTDLAMDSGYYSSNGDVLDEHTQYYNPRTIAHNTITVYKPGQYTHVQYWPGARNTDNDDGGQRGFGRERRTGTDSSANYDPPYEYEQFIEDKYDRGRVNRFEHDQNSGYTYFTGDVTPAYYSDSVSTFTRTVLTPDAERYIILDRVSSTDPGYPKRWLLHTENEPQAVGGSKSSQNPSDGSIAFSGSSQYYAENGSSRLFVKMLEPINNNSDTILFRGGPGFEYWYGYDSTGFNADDVHDTPGGNEAPGNWRVEHKIQGETDSVFLNVLYATDTSTATIGHAELMTSSYNVLAVELEDYACVFSKPETKGGSYLEDGNYTVSSSQATRHIVTDLHAGTAYDIYRNGTLLNGTPYTSSEKGIITFTAAGTGIYRVALNGVPPSLTAEFSTSATTVAIGQSVQFTDTSTGGCTSWSWDFDNNGSVDSTLQNPQYTYPDLGTYTVSLTVSNGGQNNTVTKYDFITVVKDVEVSPESRMFLYLPAILDSAKRGT